MGSNKTEISPTLLTVRQPHVTKGWEGPRPSAPPKSRFTHTVVISGQVEYDCPQATSYSNK